MRTFFKDNDKIVINSFDHSEALVGKQFLASAKDKSFKIEARNDINDEFDGLVITLQDTPIDPQKIEKIPVVLHVLHNDGRILRFTIESENKDEYVLANYDEEKLNQVKAFLKGLNLTDVNYTPTKGFTAGEEAVIDVTYMIPEGTFIFAKTGSPDILVYNEAQVVHIGTEIYVPDEDSPFYHAKKLSNMTTNLEAIKEEYYHKFDGQTLTIDSSEFKPSVYYADLGLVADVVANTCVIGEKTYDIDTTITSLGNLGYIKVPAWIIKNHHLYVSYLHLIGHMSNGYVRVKSGLDTYDVTAEILTPTLKLKDVVPVTTQKGETNSVTFDDVDNIITQVSSHGNQSVGITLADEEGNQVEQNDIVYYIDDTMVAVSEQDKPYTLVLYPKRTQEKFNKEERITTNRRIIIPNVGEYKFKTVVSTITSED